MFKIPEDRLKGDKSKNEEDFRNSGKAINDIAERLIKEGKFPPFRWVGGK